MDDKDFSFRNLIVWQKAMQFAKLVYALVSEFPAVEKYALSDQVRRAVVSIASNIAEGCGRASNRDFAHFLSVARGSLYETMTQLELAKSIGYVKSIEEAEAQAAEISRMLTTLMKKYISLTPSTSSNTPS
jgi:four helix bundle protein